MSLPKAYKGYGFALGHHVMASSTSIVLKVFMGLTSLSTTIMLWYLSGTVLTVIVSVIRSRRLDFRPVLDKLNVYLPISVIMGFAVIGWFTSIRYAGPGLSAFVGQLGIVFSVLLGTLALGERFTRTDAAGAFLAICGALAITYRSSSDVMFGIAAGMLGALCFAVQGFLMKRHAKHIDKIDLLLVRGVVASAMVFPFALVSGGLGVPDPKLLAVICVTAAVIHVTVNFLLYLALDYIDLSKLAVLSVVQPVVAMIGAYWVLGEVPTTAQVGGSVLILMGITLILLQPLFAARAVDMGMAE